MVENLRDLRPKPSAFGDVRGRSFKPLFGEAEDAMDLSDPDVRMPQEMRDKIQSDVRELDPNK